MPLSSDCMISAPSTEPKIEPLPPASAVPPMTAAAITYSSMPVPSELVPALSRAIDTMAATVTSTASSANNISVTRCTGMPTSAAASGLPPIANT
ncbi:hypothetical protein D3C72_1314510 [compost metagenome]